MYKNKIGKVDEERCFVLFCLSYNFKQGGQGRILAVIVIIMVVLTYRHWYS